MGFLQVIQYDIARFKRRGLLYMTLGYAQLISFVYFSLQIGRVCWPKILGLHENRVLLWFVLSIVYNIVYLSLLNLMYGLIYYLQHPFFEQYKIIPKPWPWKDPDPKIAKRWWKLYYSTIGRVSFNAFILVPILQVAGLARNGWKIPYKMEPEELPDYKTLIF